MACVAAARRGGIKSAGSEEFRTGEGENVVYIMEGQCGKESTGGTMRLGDYPAKLVKGSKVAGVYGSEDVIERHRHRYEVNQKFCPRLSRADWWWRVRLQMASWWNLWRVLRISFSWLRRRIRSLGRVR